jgi:hypothetical protein
MNFCRRRSKRSKLSLVFGSLLRTRQESTSNGRTGQRLTIRRKKMKGRQELSKTVLKSRVIFAASLLTCVTYSYIFVEWRHNGTAQGKKVRSELKRPEQIIKVREKKLKAQMRQKKNKKKGSKNKGQKRH